MTAPGDLLFYLDYLFAGRSPRPTKHPGSPLVFMLLTGLEGFAKLLRALYRFIATLLSGGVSTLED